MPQDEFERAVDNAIAHAIDATSTEIFDAAFGKDESTLDETGDQTLETMGDGLEGEIEADDDDTDEGEEQGEEEGDGKEKPELGTKPETKTETKPDAETKPVEPEGRIPPGKLREANEARRIAEARIAELTKQGDTERTQTRRELDELKGQITGLTQLLRQQAKPAETPAEAKAEEPPDIFENPKGFVDHLKTIVSQAVQPLAQKQENNRVATSFEIAHGFHKEAFDKAIAAVQTLDPNNPDNRATVQRIWASPNPGEALVQWHKRNETLREVGDDPAAYRERLAKETRESLMKDPEFRKQLLADLRAEAEGDGNTVFTPPRSLNGARGGRVAVDTSVLSDDPQAIFDSAFAGR